VSANSPDATICVHHPMVTVEGYRSFSVPVYRASTIVFADLKAYRERVARSPDGYVYGLAGTPTSRTLEAQLTMLNRAARSIVVPSGQAAISTLMLTVLKAGDHILIPDNVYPPTKQFAADTLSRFGVDHDVYDPMDLTTLRDHFVTRPSRLVWIESPGSTTMEVCDIPAIVELAWRHGAMTGCDNTWATPLFCKPLELGVDVVAEALTKYVGGHSDLLLGALSFAEIGLYTAVRNQLSTLGVGVSPDECSLALRGIETLALRLNHMEGVALDLAKRIAARLGEVNVLHPALASCPGHSTWRRDFTGSSGVFSIRLPGVSEEQLSLALDALKVFAIGASWGGTRSLVAPMDISAVRSVSQIDTQAPYLRISIGLENPADLWRDLEGVVGAVGY
jgi:cysteine-S-conjugate beta-lyase